jgi:hypothetical protein
MPPKAEREGKDELLRYFLRPRGRRKFFARLSAEKIRLKFIARNMHLTAEERDAVLAGTSFPVARPVYHPYEHQGRSGACYGQVNGVGKDGNGTKSKVYVHRVMCAMFRGVPEGDATASHLLQMRDFRRQTRNMNPHHLVWEDQTTNSARNTCRTLYYHLRDEEHNTYGTAADYVHQHLCAHLHAAHPCIFSDD